MEIKIDNNAPVPVFQQIIDQVHFAINTGGLAPGEKLPSIRALASANEIAANTVAKAFRQLEFRGLIEAQERSGFRVRGPDSSRYQARGVSADKTEVHEAIHALDEGAVPGAFCKVTEDFLGGDPDRFNVIHSDGSGTKSIIAYLHYRETGDASVFHGIAQDSIVMNLDDLLCVGANGRILFSNTINRNAMNCPGEVVNALIQGSEAFLETLRDQGVDVYSGGGETADVGDLTGTVVVDSCAVTVMKKSDVIANRLGADLSIIGLAADGQCHYETTVNSGIGSNGLTSARHDLLSGYYAERYPETFDPNIAADLVYCGPYRLDERCPESTQTVGEALLSPTRTYAPVISALIRELGPDVRGIIHCSGGAQTKCLNFGQGIHFVKDKLFTPPPIFKAIQAASETPWSEMYKVFNMGHRMEIYVPASRSQAVIDAAASFGINAAEIGHTERADSNRLSLTGWDGTLHQYSV